jgi:hypothetical protein
MRRQQFLSPIHERPKRHLTFVWDPRTHFVRKAEAVVSLHNTCYRTLNIFCTYPQSLASSAGFTVLFVLPMPNSLGCSSSPRT